MRHHFTVDVEEYFNFLGFERRVPFPGWGHLESRIERSVDALLDLLARYDARATFFVLGWVAERHPGMVRRIAGAGHEIASHGWDHRRVVELEPQAFRESVRRTKGTLEDLCSVPVLGFRAPHYSVVSGTEWALDVLVEEGYVYDSSLFPVRRRGYGYVNGRRDPHVIRRSRGGLVEFPPMTLKLGGWALPAGGGAYFRFFPYTVFRAALRSCERRKRPGTFYIHPWELDPDQPLLDVPALDRVRHYTGLRRTLPRLRRLLAEFRFGAIADTLRGV